MPSKLAMGAGMFGPKEQGRKYAFDHGIRDIDVIDDHQRPTCFVPAFWRRLAMAACCAAPVRRRFI
jgi:hypothetical protein